LHSPLMCSRKDGRHPDNFAALQSAAYPFTA